MIGTIVTDTTQIAAWFRAALAQADPAHGNDLQGALRLLHEVGEVVARDSREAINAIFLQGVVLSWHGEVPMAQLKFAASQRQAIRHHWTDLLEKIGQWLAHLEQAQVHTIAAS